MTWWVLWKCESNLFESFNWCFSTFFNIFISQPKISWTILSLRYWGVTVHTTLYDNTYNRCITIHKTSSSNVYMYLVNQYISNIPVTYDEIYKVDLHHYLICSKVVQLVILTMFTWRLSASVLFGMQWAWLTTLFCVVTLNHNILHPVTKPYTCSP